MSVSPGARSGPEGREFPSPPPPPRAGSSARSPLGAPQRQGWQRAEDGFSPPAELTAAPVGPLESPRRAAPTAAFAPLTGPPPPPPPPPRPPPGITVAVPPAVAAVAPPPPPPAAPAAAGGGGGSLPAQLRELFELRQCGGLSEEEFAAAKAVVLGQHRGPAPVQGLLLHEPPVGAAGLRAAGSPRVLHPAPCCAAPPGSPGPPLHAASPQPRWPPPEGFSVHTASRVAVGPELDAGPFLAAAPPQRGRPYGQPPPQGCCCAAPRPASPVPADAKQRRDFSPRPPSAVLADGALRHPPPPPPPPPPGAFPPRSPETNWVARPPDAPPLAGLCWDARLSRGVSVSHDGREATAVGGGGSGDHVAVGTACVNLSSPAAQRCVEWRVVLSLRSAGSCDVLVGLTARCGSGPGAGGAAFVLRGDGCVVGEKGSERKGARYGPPLGGDGGPCVVGCSIDVPRRTVSFSVGGEQLGEAFDVPRDILAPLYPIVVLSRDGERACIPPG